MSKAIVAMINIMAIPKGLFSSNFRSEGATANPVMVGSINKRLRRRIAETMFNMNSEVFIYSLT